MNTSTANISITLQPSLALMFVFSFLHLLAAISISLLSISIVLKLSGILLVIYSATTILSQFVLLKSNSSIVKLKCTENGNAQLSLKTGEKLQSNLTSCQWLFNYFVVMVFKNSKKHKVVIAKDALSQEQFYALRLYLRSFNTSR